MDLYRYVRPKSFVRKHYKIKQKLYYSASQASQVLVFKQPSHNTWNTIGGGGRRFANSHFDGGLKKKIKQHHSGKEMNTCEEHTWLKALGDSPGIGRDLFGSLESLESCVFVLSSNA